MSENNKQIIKKIDAARRQLDTSITLWFHESDTVAIHVLACSAHQIIHDINQHRGGPELLFDSIVIKDEFRGLAKRCLHKPYNFFKHANNDPDPEGVIELNAFASESFIIYASMGLEFLGIKPNSIRTAFTIYQVFHTPDIFTEQGRHSILKNIPIDQLADIKALNRKQFFERYIALQKVTGTYRP